MRSPRRAAWLSLGLALLGCGAAPAATAEAPRPPEPEAPAPIPPLHVSAIRAPDRVAIDGDLVEWPSLSPNEVGVAVSSRALHVVARLAGDAPTGAWLGIDGGAPFIPKMGVVIRGDQIDSDIECDFERVELAEAAHERGKPNPPEVVAACQADLQRYADLKASFTARFTRLLRVDREGVRVAAGEKLSPIEGAKVVVKPGEGELVVEAELPLRVLPRLSEAPLKSLSLIARPASGALADLPAASEWTSVKLPEPVGFEPWPALRAFAMQRQSEGHDHTGFTSIHNQGRAQSYSPGEPSIESLVYGASYMVVGPQVTPLHEEINTFGELSVGKVPSVPEDAAAARDGLAISKNGNLLDVFELRGEIQGSIVRGGELHVVSYAEREWDTGMGMDSFAAARWSVVAVRADGTHRDVPLDELMPLEGAEALVRIVRETLPGKDLDGFGVIIEHEKHRFQLTWRWDEKRGRYAGKKKRVPMPPKKAKGGPLRR